VRTARWLTAATLGAIAFAVAPGAASAHPLGNFTVNVFSGLRVGPDRVDIELVVDMAEIPAFQARREADATGPDFAPRSCGDAVRLVTLSVDGRPAPLRVRASDVAFPPGAGGLDTLRLTCSLEAAVGDATGTHELRFGNRLYADRVGWREIIAVGDGATLVTSDVPADSASAALTAYPDDLLSSPLRQTEASVRFRAGGRAAPAPGRSLGLPSRADRATERLTALVGGDLTPIAGLLAFCAALVLGGLHSLAPGHGKTLMAAYLVGQRGSFRQATWIGLTVTLTHTAGVLVLGLVLSVGTGLAPERFYPWFGIGAGALVAAIGVGLVRRAWRRPAWPALGHHHHDDDHHVDDHHGHGHHNHGHDHHGHLHGRRPRRHHALRQHDLSLERNGSGSAGSPTLVTVPARPHAGTEDHDRHAGATSGEAGGGPSRRSLLAMGLAGGIVPTPSAIVVLLGAVAIGRAWFGVLLVVAYGLGMAGVLIGAGLLLSKARSAVERRLIPGTRSSWVLATLPTATAVVVLGAGLFLVARAAQQL